MYSDNCVLIRITTIAWGMTGNSLKINSIGLIKAPQALKVIRNFTVRGFKIL